MKNYVNCNKLIEKFEDMAKRNALLTRNVSQEDLLIQIIGAIVKCAMEGDEENKVYVVIRNYDLHDFTDSHGDSPQVQGEIVRMYSSREAAEKKLTELEESCKDGESWYEIEKWIVE